MIKNKSVKSEHIVTFLRPFTTSSYTIIIIFSYSYTVFNIMCFLYFHFFPLIRGIELPTKFCGNNLFIQSILFINLIILFV